MVFCYEVPDFSKYPSPYTREGKHFIINMVPESGLYGAGVYLFFNQNNARQGEAQADSTANRTQSRSVLVFQNRAINLHILIAYYISIMQHLYS